jgi:hypothetical protein
MNSYCATIWLSKVTVTKFHPPLDNIVWRSRSINEEQIVMSNSIVYEVFLIILLFVKSYYSFHTEFLEDFNVLIWVMPISLILVSLFDWSHESHELPRNNPIKIAIFNSFVQLVFLDIECFEFIPVELNSVL